MSRHSRKTSNAMNASDIMTSPVITVGPDTLVRHIAGLLYEHRISAVPVLEKGKLVGIVSEADLLHRHEIGTDRSARSWWLQLFSADRSIGDYVKSHATRARDIMTRNVVSSLQTRRSRRSPRCWSTAASSAC